MKNIKYIYIAILSVLVTSCSSFLDTMPDNRAEIDSSDKVRKLLVSAYPTNGYIMTNEVSSDNVDTSGPENPYTSKFVEQLYNWEDVTEFNNESPTRIWGSCYLAIASANQALASIEELGEEDLQGARSEALLCRAYSHFVLVNMFAQHFSEANSSTDLGVYYMTAPETTLNPKYQRQSVLSNYKDIEKDILEGISLINQTKFDVPKYHFNDKAAYAFATRFFLYKGDMDAVIKYASLALGSNPETQTRDNKLLATYPTDAISKQFISPSLKANYLLMTAYSDLGLMFGPYYSNSKINHKAILASTETTMTNAPWGQYSRDLYYLFPRQYSGSNLDKVLSPKLPYLFEYTDAVAQTGYRRTVYAAFTADEVLLSRAEAYVRKGNYDAAVSDLNVWLKANVKNYTPMTEATLLNWIKDMPYYTPINPTPRKKLNPEFTVQEGKQEQLLQIILYARRIETIHTGLRWMDIKRYGIEVTRRVIESNRVVALGSTLTVRDKRLAIQLPAEVIAAGLEANPR